MPPKATKNTIPEQSAEDAIPEKTTSKLRRLVVQNFRCIGQSAVSIDLDDIVVLVGPNNAGKNTILRAYQAITESSAPKLTIEDFHERKVDSTALPTVELYTAVGDDLPGNRWVNHVDGESIVRERWIWSAPEVAAKRQGWDVSRNDWDDSFPWGPANIAKARRPVPYRIEAFANPTTQIKEVADLLLKVLQGRMKGRPADARGDDGVAERTDFGQLLDALAKTQKTVVEEAKAEIEETETQLSTFVSEVFT